MGTAAQIRSYRVRAGKSPGEVAERLGLNAAWYGDLEQHDDELASTLTLFQAMELASILGVRLRDLLSDRAPPDESISLVDLPSRIAAHVAREGISIEQFEDEVGWELREFMTSPIKGAAELPILFLQAISAPLGINWLSLVPDEHAV
jgi:transcriptional regulator with XRE-family HTH domain